MLLASVTCKIIMGENDKSHSRNQQSVKFRAKPLKGPYGEIAEFADESNFHISPNDNTHTRKSLASQSPEILSTSDLISAVGQIWDCASRSLARLQRKASVSCSDSICEKDNDSCYLVGSNNFHLFNLIDCGFFHVDLNSSCNFSCIVQQSLQFVRASRRMHCNPCNDHFIDNIFWRSGDDSSIRHDMRLKEKNLNVGTHHSLMNRYEWISQISIWRKPPMFASSEAKMIAEALISEAPISHGCPVSENEVSSSNAKSQNLDKCIDTPNIKNLSSGGSDEVLVLQKESLSFLYTYNLFREFHQRNSTARMSEAFNLGLHLDEHVSTSASDCTHESNQLNIDADQLLDKELTQCEKFNTKDEHQSESSSSVTNKPHQLLAKQDHAVSGALAGICVSLCLHPIDTVKTIIQSCQPGQKSICYIGQSVLSERGLPGLYRGITSNITTSAPISAIYTFTYESMKEFLLPSLAKEYHSVAHCTAGACASIATSFVFTPSERIKQQMQVNSKYQNCWIAVQRIIETGGLRSLYTGWGAVLCRNIPHSIIKFYTYESMKQMLMSSQPPNKQPNTLQTNLAYENRLVICKIKARVTNFFLSYGTLMQLLCGGLAGSTAALFSTPFDVVKTRLQTQIPGSIQRYHSILNVLQDICEHEGVRGLYRGLIPRLAMYMSQGALFFASYEFLKSLLSSELRQHKKEILQHKPNSNDDPLLSF
ncbi:Mitoferrin [Bienertia sinuspersici]